MALEVSTVKDRSGWTIQRCESFDEVRRLHIREWQTAGESARPRAAWELVFDHRAGMKGMNPDELKLPLFTRGIPPGLEGEGRR